jgi:DNA (cytosine-5)-methyltransferase 1
MAKFISLFAGVGGFDLGMEQAGHECVAQVEWDKNAAGVLKHRWPNVPLFCDVSKVSADDLPDADFITYGFPCQDLSVAGKREGLDGKRSGLFYEATRLIKQLAERAIRRGGVGGGRFIAIAENVKGLLSSGDGYDFARCIRELHNIGASEVGFSVLDSQYFGVAQRRKRVFIVADFGGESTSEILAFSEGVSGHPAPSREAGKRTAGDATKGVGEGGRGYRMTAFGEYQDDETASCMKSRDYKDATDLIAQGADSGIIDRAAFNQGVNAKYDPFIGNTECCPSIVSRGPHATFHKPQEPAVVSWNGDTTPKASEDVSVTLRSQQGGEGVGVATYEWHNQDSRIREQQQASTLSCNAGGKEGNLVRENLTVRRLTPIECERLQGFPDNWTSVKMELILEGNEWKATGKVVKQADGPRYRQQGNAVTVNVAEWIGKQIGKVLDK